MRSVAENGDRPLGASADAWRSAVAFYHLEIPRDYTHLNSEQWDGCSVNGT